MEKKLGRPKKDAAIPADSIPETESPRDPNAGKRPKRQRLGIADLKLNYPEHLLDRQKFNYHWALDDPSKPGRIDSLIARYYEHEMVNGKKVMRPAGANTHFLMKLPMKFYLEDKADKKQKILARSGEQNKIGANEYAPNPKTGEGEGGETAVTGSRDNHFT